MFPESFDGAQDERRGLDISDVSVHAEALEAFLIFLKFSGENAEKMGSE